MKNKKAKISLACAAFIALVNFPYAPTTGTAETEKPVYTDGTELFTKQLMLGAYAEPEPSDIRFNRLKEIGFNTMYMLNETSYNTARLITYLEKCEEHDLKAIVGIGCNRKAPVSIKTQKTSLAEYDSFMGIYMCDEPLGDGSPLPQDEINATEGTNWESYNTIYDYMAAEYEYMKETYPGRYCSAVICYGMREGWFGYKSLDAYVEKVLSVMEQKDRSLEYDCYPLRVTSEGEAYFGDSWLLGPYKFAETRKDYSVPKLTFFYQQEWDYKLRERIGIPELLYQLYTSMCFGVNGLVAYKYDSYWTDWLKANDFFMHSAWGESELCYYNQVAFAELKKFDHIYLDFVNNWQGVMSVYGTSGNDNKEYRNVEQYLEGKYVLESYAGLQSITATEDALIGVMKDSQGRDGYMVTNQAFSLDKLSNTVKMAFNGGYSKAIVVLNGEETVVELKDGACEFTLAPGKGAFVIPY